MLLSDLGVYILARPDVMVNVILSGDILVRNRALASAKPRQIRCGFAVPTCRWLPPLRLKPSLPKIGMTAQKTCCMATGFLSEDCARRLWSL